MSERPRRPARGQRAAVLLLALLLSPGAALAHGLSLFAAADGARIEGVVRFAGGNPAAGTRVRVLDTAGNARAVLETDAAGRFAYTATVPEDHRLIAETADGHQASWTVAAAELAAGLGAGLTAGAGPDLGAPPGGCDTASLEQAVARAVRPLREELAADAERARLRDLLGGIGYILGIAGLWAWWRARRTSPDGPRPAP